MKAPLILVALILVLLIVGFSEPLQVGFNPSSVNLVAGQSITVSLTVFGLTTTGDIGAQSVIIHDAAHTPITNASCTGIFAGADTLRHTDTGSGPVADWIGCAFTDGVSVASGTSGTFVTFTVTNVTGLPETLTFDTRYTLFLRPDFGGEFPSQLGSLVINPALTSTNTPTQTRTPTNTPTGTLVPSNTPTSTQTLTTTPTGTSIVLPPPNTRTPTATGTPATPTATPCHPARRCGDDPPCWPPGHCRTLTPTPQILLPCFVPQASWCRN